jgi:hypothetical protein
VSSSYDANYLNDDDFPVGEDEVFAFADTAEEKRAIDAAESQLELDVNDAQEIDDPNKYHSEAVALYATYRLARAARHPASSAQGQLGDGGADNTASYAEALLRDYRNKVELIEDTDQDDDYSSGSGGTDDGGSGTSRATLRSALL